MALSAPELLNARHDLSQFSCGRPALDNWLKTRALANQEKGFTVVMVVHDEGRVVGYYGLAPSAVVASV
ncbi:MAG: N-acetyltransferase, partial [Geminicoccaceae bacterium]